MTEAIQVQIQAYVARLNELIRRGRELESLLASDPSDAFVVTTTRVWQQDVGVTVNELSGGSKAHWLARAFSEAFLMRSAEGGPAEGAAPDQIVNRLVAVLELAVTALSRADGAPLVSASEAAPPHRFDFVHNHDLRPVLEQSYIESKRAFEGGLYANALQTSCGIVEAIVTDALDHTGLAALVASGAPTGKIADWSFETRLTVAERAGLIRGGWARLPAVAWTYRDQDADGSNPISERDARVAGQVLNVVMRDLNPGR
jgi:hypothetical protein